MPGDEKKFCFVISPIGEAGSDAQRRADGVLDEIIRSALPEEKYRVKRADHDKTPGIVTEGIINDIIDADLVIADLTGTNPNVMYELAIRHALATPFVQMMEEGQELPFDIAPVNTVSFRSDLRGRKKAISDLREAASRAMEQGDIGNPIRRTAQFRGLNPEKGSKDDLVLMLLRDLNSKVGALEYNTPIRVASSPSQVASLTTRTADGSVLSIDARPDLEVGDHRCELCGSKIDEGTLHIMSGPDKRGNYRESPLCGDCGRFAMEKPTVTWEMIEKTQGWL